MRSFFRHFKYFGIVLGILSIIIVSVFYNILKVDKILPIYQPASVNAELVDSTIQHQKKYHKIADFNLMKIKSMLLISFLRHVKPFVLL